MKKLDYILFPLCLMGIILNGYWITKGDSSIITVVVLVIASMGFCVGLLNIVEKHIDHVNKITGVST